MSPSYLKYLATDFARWGSRAIHRIQSKTKKWGVITSPYLFSDGKMG